MARLLKESKTPSTNLKKTVTEIAFQMVADKEYTAYDLVVHLMKHRGKSFDSPTELVRDDGTNMLHEMVDKGRLSMFIVIIMFGWWTILSKMKIPERSYSEHSGSTALEIAEKKRTRKPYEEVTHYTNWEKSLTPLMKACRSGDLAKARALATNSGDLQETYLIDLNGWNALHWAVLNGSKELVELLLEAGVDSSVKTKKNETLLHIACSFGKTNLIKFLTRNDKCQLNPYEEDVNDKSPYDRVAENGDIESLLELVKCGYKPNLIFLVLAAFTGRQRCVEYCINDMGMDVNGTDVYERTALHRACESKKEKVVKFLLTKGADITFETCTKRNILHTIADSGSIIIFNILMEALKKQHLFAKMINMRDRYNGVELCFLIRGRDRGRDAWHYVEVRRWLVPLFLQKTRSGNVDVAVYGTVIRSGWGVNPDQENITAIEKIFKERKLNTNADLDMTPLHIALFKGHTELAQLLLHNGAEVNAKDNFGLTPLMIAASTGKVETIKLLERSGAMFDAESTESKTALAIAEENEQDEIVKYIKGMDFFHLCQNFVRGPLTHYKDILSEEKLNEVRSRGEDVKAYIVDTLRDMRIEINQTLQKMGSGPVLQASE